nr:RidA family protein [uncultured Roseovarius sp.]
MNKAFDLPRPIGTAYQYVMASRHDDIIYLAGQIAKIDEETLHATGICGVDVDLACARRNAEIAAGQALAWLVEHLQPGEEIGDILRMTVHVAVADRPFDISAVADAASNTFISALGERGRHPRSVIGVGRLPRNAPVLLEVTAAIARGRDVSP